MQAKHPRGFSIIELMVVTTTIGILALLSIPSIRIAVDRTEAAATANDIRVFTEAIEFFTTIKGTYPEAMTYTRMPNEIASYLPSPWKSGQYSWFYVNTENLTYVYLYNLSFTAEQAVRLDSIIDDGNIATGNVRMAYNGSGLVYLFQYYQADRESIPEINDE
ncbi:prepilin-type N-terminal cleavage/methylation domain-containing protein [Coraliomargarita sp. SDUM461004]|uniref:Prepilin-type N-terminal cleavage/methylation domain-containing protein n=1 Tax=Thalassobacterium sedimentorum TaxID=3041258 RepID=A0ABU1AG26_9BACT|nr:prepilin-type N-terminal cleavage/methylation domain-containing protein [Coraliomargarita sp. SDUM461004]MDQ8193627.1 prepilin-type N-terminal cleavage/methylation domain-containing protein [Coraliomargarita sp. SDUM461004]